MSWCKAVGFGIALLALAAGLTAIAESAAREPEVVCDHVDGVDTHHIVTCAHAVPHISTVPANKGEIVKLFVRERVRQDGHGKKPRHAVLMIHGRTVPVLAFAELRFGDYDWALSLAEAEQAGDFDVFMLDFQGSGRSPRPKMDDPCNVPIAQQRSLLIPNRPLKTTCPPSYGFTLNTAQSDSDELDTVVEYIRNLRGVDKVHLVGWSQASFRIGPYAAKHPDKVAGVLLVAPIFNAGIEPAFPQPPSNPPVPLPAKGTPMALQTRAGFLTGWDAELNGLKCPDQREPGIEDVVWAAIMENDVLGRTWGPPEGVMRVRQLPILWGWNADVLSSPDFPKLDVPTLIIRGELDSGQGGRQHVAQLYDLVQNTNKLRFEVQCTGHFMAWENRRAILHQISKEWIKHGKVAGHDHGEFFIDTEGNLSDISE